MFGVFIIFFFFQIFRLRNLWNLYSPGSFAKVFLMSEKFSLRVACFQNFKILAHAVVEPLWQALV